MTVHIRMAQADDGHAIARVRVKAWQTAYRNLLPDEMLDGMDIQAEGQIWSDRLETLPAENSFFVAQNVEPLQFFQEQGILGFCACGPEREMDPIYTAEIYALYVLPGSQGKGIGRSLVQAAVSRLHQQGYKQMIIYVLRDNHAARGFYEAIGGTLARERLWDVRGVKMPEVGYGYPLGADHG